MRDLRRAEAALRDDAVVEQLPVALEAVRGQSELRRGLQIGALGLGQLRALQARQRLPALHGLADCGGQRFDQCRERSADDVHLAVRHDHRGRERGHRRLSIGDRCSGSDAERLDLLGAQLDLVRCNGGAGHGERPRPAMHVFMATPARETPRGHSNRLLLG